MCVNFKDIQKSKIFNHLDICILSYFYLHNILYDSLKKEILAVFSEVHNSSNKKKIFFLEMETSTLHRKTEFLIETIK